MNFVVSNYFLARCETASLGPHHQNIDTSESTYFPCFPFAFVSFALVIVTQTMSLADVLCFRTAGMLGPNHEFFDASDRMYSPFFVLFFLTRTKASPD